MMDKYVARDDRFQKIIQQRIVVSKWYSRVWPNANIMETDIKNNPLAKMLDIKGIMDKIVESNGLLHGLAQRIQRYSKYEWVMKKYGEPTLTIRDIRFIDGMPYYHSELTKVKQAIKKHSLCASYRVHCYANGDSEEETTDLMDGIIVDQYKLFKWMNENPDCAHHEVTHVENKKKQTFIFIFFSDIPTSIVIDRYQSRKTRQYDKIARIKSLKNLVKNIPNAYVDEDVPCIVWPGEKDSFI